MSDPYGIINYQRKVQLMKKIHTVMAFLPNKKKVIDLTYDADNFTADEAIKSVEDKGLTVISVYTN
jgi:hypothetical protein